MWKSKIHSFGTRDTVELASNCTEVLSKKAFISLEMENFEIYHLLVLYKLKSYVFRGKL